MQILNRKIKKGEKYIEDYIINDNQGNQVALPYYVIVGCKDGPVVCITSGIHGTEYPGIAANLKLYHHIDPQKLSGTIIGVTICNFASFKQRVPFVNPMDDKNLNDTFPGNAHGTITEKIANILLSEFVSKADCHIDMHSGDSIEYLHPYVFYHLNDSRPHVNEFAMKMAEAYALDYISITETDGKGSSDKGNFYASVSEMGIPSIQPEIGGIGLVERKTKMLHYNGATNVLILLGMLSGKPTINKNQTFINEFYRLRSSFDGIFNCNVAPGQKIKTGQLLATITDYHCKEVYASFSAKSDCVILWVMASLVTCKDDNLMAIGII